MNCCKSLQITTNCHKSLWITVKPLWITEILLKSMQIFRILWILMHHGKSWITVNPGRINSILCKSMQILLIVVKQIESSWIMVNHELQINQCNSMLIYRSHKSSQFIAICCKSLQIKMNHCQLQWLYYELMQF